MDWNTKLQDIIDYVENHLQRDQEPVSYTHLDVYKRQPQIQRRLIQDHQSGYLEAVVPNSRDPLNEHVPMIVYKSYYLVNRCV